MISVVVIQAELLGKQERESEVDSFALPQKGRQFRDQQENQRKRRPQVCVVDSIL